MFKYQTIHGMRKTFLNVFFSHTVCLIVFQKSIVGDMKNNLATVYYFIISLAGFPVEYFYANHDG